MGTAFRYADGMTNTATATATTTIVLIWAGLIYHQPTGDLFEQTHEFAHGNVKSARRTALARVRRWHGDVRLLAVMVNPTEQQRTEASDRAYAEFLASKAA